MRTTAHVAKSGGIALGGFTGRPTRNYTSRVDIRMLSVPTRQTAECRLVGPIALVDMPASRTFSRCVARIDGEQENSGEHRFVGDECSQLREGPTMQNRTLRFPNRYSIADSTEFLDGNPASGAFGCLNDLLADNMIGMHGESSLTPGKCLQSALGGACPLCLTPSEVLAISAMPRSTPRNELGFTCADSVTSHVAAR
jgi:hypothetical protein